MKQLPEYQQAILAAWERNYGRVVLQCDEYEVTFVTGLYGKHIKIEYFIGGEYLGEWCQPDNPIGSKFGQPKFSRYSKVHYNFVKKWGGKKEADAYRKKTNETKLMNLLLWTNPRSLIRHLKKTCQNITINNEQSTNYRRE